MAEIVTHESTIDLPKRPIPEDVITAVRVACKKVGLQEIRIAKGKPITVIWKSTATDTLDFDLDEISVDDAISSLDTIIPFNNAGMTPEATIGAVLREIGERGKCVTHFVVGARTLLWRWLKYVPTSADGAPPRRLFGVGQLLVSESSPEYHLLVVAGPTPFGDITDADLAYNIIMEP